MSRFQRYVFQNVLRTLAAIVGGLVLIALLTQGLTQIDLIVENRQSTLVYLWVSLLAAPQIVSLLLPIALFVAAVSALNRMHRESEVVVAQASGLSNWGVASPVIRLATLALILHLGLNLWVQPMSYREMRAAVTNAKADLASSLVRPGEYSYPADGLTVYVRDANGNELRGLLINDSRDPKTDTTYIARSGVITLQEGVPTIIMRDGHVQQLSKSGALETLYFDQSPFDLGPFMGDTASVILKASDRFLPELFFPDRTNFYDNRNANALLAEGHSRIASPLLNLSMAMLAVLAVLGGQFSRRGYSIRIASATAGAILLRLVAFGAVSAAEDDPALNVLQYAVPFGVFLVLLAIFVLPGARRLRRRQGPAADRVIGAGV